jgi:FAD synthase
MDNQAVRSTAIRRFIQTGEKDKAEAMLGKGLDTGQNCH